MRRGAWFHLISIDPAELVALEGTESWKGREEIPNRGRVSGMWGEMMGTRGRGGRDWDSGGYEGCL